VGGDMASGGAPVNDPVFFLHHANVDRLWAEWQAANIAAGRATDVGNSEYPEMWRGKLFIFEDVRADEMFDHLGLGYGYDTQQGR
jgi:tyrosinase